MNWKQFQREGDISWKRSYLDHPKDHPRFVLAREGAPPPAEPLFSHFQTAQSFVNDSMAFYGGPFWRPIDTSVYSWKLLKRGEHENTELNVETLIFISLRVHKLNANY